MEQRQQLKTSRGLLKYILFSLITARIYSVVVFSLVSDELNTVCKDNKRTTPFWIIWFLSLAVCAIPIFIWFHITSNRMGNELKRRGINYSISASTFWGWGFLGAFIIIGPFVYVHKFLKASNLLNADFNQKGE